MNVLLVHPEVPFSALSFPRIGNIMGAKSFTAPLGLITVASLLPDTWGTRLADLNCRDLTEEDWEWADLVFVSGMILQGPGLLSLVREAKARKMFVVCGGPYVSSLPEPALEAGVDVLVRGEAESVPDEILQAIRERRTGTVIHAKKKPDMTGSPLPRFDLLDFSQYFSMSIQTSRGCPYGCEFCDVVNLFGHAIRYKAPDQIIQEFEALYRLGWRGWVMVTDDNFTGNKERARSILHEMIAWNKAHGTPMSFFTQASMDLAADPELIDLMIEANFSYVLVGVESPDRSVLEISGKLHNLKHPIVDSLRAINERGLSVIASFVIGPDGEQKGVHQRICALVEAAGVALAFVFVLQALPNTRLWHRLESEGRLLPENTSGDAMKISMNFVPSRPATEILQEWAEAWAGLYDPTRCFLRISQGLLSMPAARDPDGPAAETCYSLEPPAPDTPSAKAKANTKRLFAFERALGLQRLSTMLFREHFRLVKRGNSSRMARYIGNCAVAADMFFVRDRVQQWSISGCRSLDSAPGL